MEPDSIILTLTTSASLLLNASVWYKMGRIADRVENCENYKITPKLQVVTFVTESSYNLNNLFPIQSSVEQQIVSLVTNVYLVILIVK